LLGIFRLSFRVQATATVRPEGDQATEKYLQGFASVQPIDIHTHVFKVDSSFKEMLKRLHLHVLDILVVDDMNPAVKALEPSRSDALAVVRASPGHVALCTTFDPYRFTNPDFVRRTVRQINEDFGKGAVAVKIWKNVGMEIKRADGAFVMPDDPVFEPIYKDIAEHNHTLIAHLAEPDSCWQSPNPASPDYNYYNEHPQWYMFMHPDHPKKDRILAARDHMLEMNPKLRVVGAHLGSMETDVDQIAKHFDKFPNFAVDTAARIPYLMLQPRDKVTAFLIKYQDRVVYGTDLQFDREATSASLDEWRETFARDWRFFATDESFDWNGQQVRGLKLPESVLLKIFHQNAVRWVPGIVAGD
jgi:predicted TIM-barrel fold metal-dependent hydrolase